MPAACWVAVPASLEAGTIVGGGQPGATGLQCVLPAAPVDIFAASPLLLFRWRQGYGATEPRHVTALVGTAWQVKAVLFLQ